MAIKNICYSVRLFFKAHNKNSSILLNADCQSC